jgi:putative effector of murein hydrolase
MMACCSFFFYIGLKPDVIKSILPTAVAAFIAIHLSDHVDPGIIHNSSFITHHLSLIIHHS